MRIALFTPVSPIQSALADFGEGLALALAQQPDVQVEVFLGKQPPPPSSPLTAQVTFRSYREFEARAKTYDVYLYSLGDHGAYHGYMLDFIYRYPGIVILNDLTLHRCILYHAYVHNNLRLYLDELKYAYTISDMRFAEQIWAGLGNYLILDYPLIEHILDCSLGVIVQNNYARERVLALRPQARVAYIPYPFFLPPGFIADPGSVYRTQIRAQLGLENHLILGSFGLFVPDKHLENCLSAFGQLLTNHPAAHYILGGAEAEGYDLAGRIHEMGLSQRITITGWLPPREFVKYMYALDIGIHLRHPHIGGTPYTPIRLMGLGINTIISEIEPLAEFPVGACIKIAPDDEQEVTLGAVLEYLAQHPDFRQTLGDNAQRFIHAHYALPSVIQKYVEFISAQ